MQELKGLETVVSVPTTGQQISDHILSAIAVGALPVGTPLPSERELAQALQVSRSSVRAGLDRLERAGFVLRRRGRGGGTFIAAGDAGELAGQQEHLATFRAERESLLDARAIVHGRLAHVAALRRTPADAHDISAAAARYAQMADPIHARSADAHFHHTIARATGNEELVRISVDLDRRINAGFRHDPFSPELFAAAQRDHAAIATAIAAGRAQEAGVLCEEHFRATTMQRGSAGAEEDARALGDDTVGRR
ncbi:GntR family transcriptional regulator [Brevibacterium sp. 91QC2O2]|uniref:FadR/GntR family transcriptional regulator n=1 Tax=Brevibacterium TaxID=1696 RepID=UPI00211C3E7B|nr:MULTISPECIES: GntR family transcriptional regulator [unclassified Brevibacterium]MCQ9366667.1 GntR family transcriptional regulator [Brevibacterium sp. 91QC2O2]MCQ9384356.1 GntR family transcriptional regulator [Brevibacterium sp. 68QC2CO]